MSYPQILRHLELHSVEGIALYFQEGGTPNDTIEGAPLFHRLVEMYTRSPRFSACVRLFVDNGLDFEESALIAVLCDDADRLQEHLAADAGVVRRRYFRFNSAFTSLEGATLLHYCAEYNHVSCAQILLNAGADVNANASLDPNGFGGQTPVFHTVAQPFDNSAEVLRVLLDHSADLSHFIKGIIWGKGYPWETFIPSVDPLSYAMMGLLPQMHRNSSQISATISLLLRYRYGISLAIPNIPNQYLA